MPDPHISPEASETTIPDPQPSEAGFDPNPIYTQLLDELDADARARVEAAVTYETPPPSAAASLKAPDEQQAVA